MKLNWNDIPNILKYKSNNVLVIVLFYNIYIIIIQNLNFINYMELLVH